MPEIADVLRRYGSEYLDSLGAHLLPSHRRAIDDILACRTEALGGQLFQCDPCGQEPDVYHSCRNRRCPKCHHLDTDAWLAERRQELLPGPYFHVVFTGPQELAEIIRRHQQDLDTILRRAAAQSLMKLALDPHDVGGLSGVLCILHTWTRTLADRPHGPGLVPAGGVSADHTEWRTARQSSLVPVHARSKLFRGLLRDLVGQDRPDLTIPESVWTKGWVVYGTPTVPGPEPGLQYLGRYVHRIALTNSRILAIEDGPVCCRYQDAQDQPCKTMTLPALEFIRRFLQHVLPQGCHKVRYYGLWSPVHRPLLHQLPCWRAEHAPHPLPASFEPESPLTDSWSPPRRAGQPCPQCREGVLVLIRSLPRHPREPP